MDGTRLALRGGGWRRGYDDLDYDDLPLPEGGLVVYKEKGGLVGYKRIGSLFGVHVLQVYYSGVGLQSLGGLMYMTFTVHSRAGPDQLLLHRMGNIDPYLRPIPSWKSIVLYVFWIGNRLTRWN